jgi:multiple sugar transport system permease protein
VERARDHDRFVDPAPGTPIRSWTWFLLIYGAIIVVGVAFLYAWDTKLGFRSRAGRLLGMSRQQRESVVAGSNGSFMKRQWVGGWICASPWIIGFLIFGAGPMLFSFVISFCRYDIINDAEFVGLDNYRRMAFDDELIGKSLWNTIYMVIAVPLGMAVSLGIALLLNHGARFMAAWRTLFYLPSIVPVVATVLLWAWLFNPQAGLINEMLRLIGIEGPKWLQSEWWSKPSLILMGLWGAGGGMIIWLAGLKGISTSLYEAAGVDGAGVLRQFWHVTLPQLTPYIFFNLVMGLIGTFQIFGEAFILTQGGPVNSTLFYVYHLFNNAFRYGQMGYASAMAWLLFVIVLVLTIFQMRLSRRWVHYEE